MPELFYKRRSKRWLAWLGLGVFVVVLDQFVKLMIVASFTYGEGLIITSFFNLVHVLNHGAAFSFLADQGGWQRWFFTGLAFVISIWLIAMIRRHQDERLQPLAFALILGGAIGNVIDRVRIGAVIDYLDFHAVGYHFPAFNLADSAITLGVILMLLQQLLEGRKSHG
ncbi:MAG: lipoprotein signal peptidase [Rhodocyclaceae bacterium]|nr:lipoprotein signal peptidase [Rhodocyclaceae bacterium]